MLDKLDRKLLSLLSQNGREAYSILAKRLRTSKQVVQYRMKRLEEQGIITQYVAVINPSKLGYMVFNQYVRLHTFEQKKVQDLIKTLQASPHVTWIAHTTGNYDLAYAIYAKTPYEFAVINRDLVQKYVSAIQQSSTLVSVQERPLNCQYIIGGRRPSVQFKTTSKNLRQVEVDAHEIALLELLSNNGRMSLVDLAQKLKISVDMVRSRMKRLQKEKVIQGFMADINPAYFDYGEYMILFNVHGSQKQEKTFVNYLREHPNVIYEIQCLGEWNLTLTLQAKDIKEFTKILEEIKSHFSTIISRYRTQIILETLKYGHLPPM